jgi:hypothetical protein
MGEPFLGRFTPAALEGKLRAHGFREVAIVAPRLGRALR